jgi:LysM repeat protein
MTESPEKKPGKPGDENDLSLLVVESVPDDDDDEDNEAEFPTMRGPEAVARQVLREADGDEHTAMRRLFQLARTQLSPEHRARTLIAIGILAVALMVLFATSLPSSSVQSGPEPTGVVVTPTGEVVIDGVSTSAENGGVFVSPTQPVIEQRGVQPQTTYVVQQGDTLFSIARRYGLSLDQLLAVNPSFAANPDLIHIGDILTIPTAVMGSEQTGAVAPQQVLPPDASSSLEHSGNIYDWGTIGADGRYCVSEGETPFGVAQRFGVTVDQIAAWNGLNPSAPVLHMGDWVVVRPPQG